MTLKKIAGIHYGRDAIFDKHWSHKQVYKSKKWVVGISSSPIYFCLSCQCLPKWSIPTLTALS